MRTITLAVLLAWCGAAAADNHYAAACADAVTGLGEIRALGASMGMEMQSAQLTAGQARRWRECQERQAARENLERRRAELEAERIRLNRILGRLPPGAGYHIVYLADGRVIRSAYFAGRSVR
jgi:hypothetical protein